MSSRNRNALHAAAAHGTPGQLRQLLSTPESASMLNAQDTKGNTPIMLAAQTSNVEACQILAQHAGLNANLADAKGRTVLHLLAARQPVQACDLAPYSELLEDILDAGAHQTPDRKGMLPLHAACNAGNYTAASTLLERHADGIRAQTPLGWCALHFAAKADSSELTMLLLRRGADATARCKLTPEPTSPQLTPLQVAEHFESPASIETLKKYLNKRRGSGPTNHLPASGTYDQLPESYDRMPALKDKPAAPLPSPKDRAPAPLPKGIPTPTMQEIEDADYCAVPEELIATPVDNEYDAIPAELSSSNSLTSSFNESYSRLPPPRKLVKNSLVQERYGNVPAYAKVPEGPSAPPVPAPLQTPLPVDDNEYDLVPTELINSKSAAPANNFYTRAEHARAEKPSVEHSRTKMPSVQAHRRGSGPGRPAEVAGGHYSRPPAPKNQSQNNYAASLVGPRLGRFYRHGWTRPDAERYLTGKKANTFVLRPTTQRDGLITLSFVHPNNGSVQHSLIYKRPEGYTFGQEFGCPPAPNLYELLEWQKLDL